MSAAGLRASLAPRASAASGGRAGDGRARRAAKARPAPRRRDRSPIRDADAATRTTAPAVSADAVQVVAPTTLEAPSDPAIGDASSPARPPVETCQHVHLGSASSVAEALARVRAGLRGLTQDASGHDGASGGGSMPPFASGVVRLTVAVPRTVDALEWLRSLPDDDDFDDFKDSGDDTAGEAAAAALLPRYYLSPRTPPPAIRSGEGDDGGDEYRHRGVHGRGKGPGPMNDDDLDDGGADGGADGSRTRRRPQAEPPEWRADPRGAAAAAGAACVWTGPSAFGARVLADQRRFLDTGEPHDTAPRVYGAGRFDADSDSVGDEWARFGGHYFFLPTLEVVEGARCATVACCVAWDAAGGAACRDGFAAAVAAAVTAVDAASRPVARSRRARLPASPPSPSGSTPTRRRRTPPGASKVTGRVLEPDQEGWVRTVDGLLRALREGEEAARGGRAGPDAAADGGGGGGPGSFRESFQSPPRVWDEEDAYGDDRYMENFAAQSNWKEVFGEVGDERATNAGTTDGAASLRDRLLELGRAAGVEAPPASVLEDLEAFAMAAGIGGGGADGDVLGGADGRRRRSGRRNGNPRNADVGAIGMGWSVDESAEDESAEDESADVEAIADAVVRASNANDGVDLAPLRKVVLARRTKLSLASPVDPLALIAALKARDPDAYQFALIHPDGAAFVGSTPERLFSARDGHAASEAVAGTRPRGSDEGEDAALAYEMLLSPKEHEEFAIVREEVRRALGTVANGGPGGVKAELEKGVLRHFSVQHLYARLGAALAPGKSEADVLNALHPTPAVCGHPRRAALDAIRVAEPFDRGLYAGPVGWVGVDSAEFAVAIRSALVSPTGDDVSLYAGVGVVAAADPAAEWRELNLKTRPLEALLAERPTPADAPNANQAWADLIVGELVRGGVGVFCVAPGSRSTPLTLAAERYPTARVVVCIDERSLGFYALGYGKGSGKAAAVITSSGTAVANLLPAAVEAHESCAPLLLLTADRPPELRDTGANQTIDQVKIFGSYARFGVDLAPPGDGSPARVAATAVATAVRHLHGPRPGPVHVNCQFRDPLGPSAVEWDARRDFRGLDGWERGSAPFTAGAPHASSSSSSSSSSLSSSSSSSSFADLSELAALIRSARKGLLVVAGGGDASSALAAAELARTLGWAVVADAASGLRVKGGAFSSLHSSLNSTLRSSHDLEWSAASAECPGLVNTLDLMLVSDEIREYVAPDVILQLNPRVTSKRVQQMLEFAAMERGAAWACVAASERRADPGHCVSLHVACDVPRVAEGLARLLDDVDSDSADGRYGGRYGASENARSCARFKETLLACDAAASREACAALGDIEAGEGISEMAVALAVTENLPPSAGLFIGNSMPIRDVDMLSGIRRRTSTDAAHSGANTSRALGAGAGPGAPVCANRGASGIDGVVSSAAGYAAGLGRPVTLLIGDVSFQHDANGLLLLRERPGQPPVTVVVVNNGGGGIFSFLPVADQIDSGSFTKLFATPPDVSRRGLCDAHRVAHSHPSTPEALKRALDAAWSEGRHSVVEVTTSRARNLEQHRALQARVARAAACALDLRTRAASAAASSSGMPRVASASVRGFELPMLKKPTTTEGEAKETAGTRRGYLLRVQLDDGRVGWGEASPLPGLHAESTEDAGAQLRAMAALLDGGDGGGGGGGVRAPPELPLLGGAVSEWLRGVVGVVDPDASLLPSVRFAVESAVLSALASPGAPLADVLLFGSVQRRGASKSNEGGEGGESVDPTDDSSTSQSVEINALIEAGLTPNAAAAEALRLVRRGHGCVKLKVARGEGSAGAMEDAARLRAIRSAVGPDVALRADANRRWSLNDALSFGLQCAELDLEYVEEPVMDPANNLAAFHCTTGVPVALDETVDECAVRAKATGTAIERALAEYFEPTFGVVALVLKPSVLGGLEATAACAAAARSRGVNVVVTTAFESGVGVATCANLAAAMDAAAVDAAAAARAEDDARARAERVASAANDGDDVVPFRASREARMRLMNSIDRGTFELGSNGDGLDSGGGGVGGGSFWEDERSRSPVASLRAMRHGLGTGEWLDGDAVIPPAAPLASLPGGGVGVDLGRLPRDLVISNETATAANVGFSSAGWGVESRHEVRTRSGVYSFRVLDSGNTPPFTPDSDSALAPPPVVFLHGFMGGAEDWNAIASAVAPERRCVAVDLPCHGRSRFVPSSKRADADDADDETTGSHEGLSVEAVAEAVAVLIAERVCPAGAKGAVLVGYSMGARVALLAAANHPGCAAAVAAVGGSGGIRGDVQRKMRADRDDAMAAALAKGGLAAFAGAWYRQGLFRALASHPRWRDGGIARRRCKIKNLESSEDDEDDEDDEDGVARDLARVLAAMSPGRQAVVTGDDLARIHRGTVGGLTLLAGDRDAKFIATARAMAADANAFLEQDEDGGDGVEVVTVPGAGHAVHLEAPEGLVLPILRVVRRT
mgnify:CR=1 FL=1